MSALRLRVLARNNFKEKGKRKKSLSWMCRYSLLTPHLPQPILKIIDPFPGHNNRLALPIRHLHLKSTIAVNIHFPNRIDLNDSTPVDLKKLAGIEF